MGIIKRILGICETKPLQVKGSWRFQEGRLEIDLTKAVELGAPGAAVRLEGGGLPERVLVVHSADGEYHAFRNRCTHVGGRRIDHLPAEKAVRCCSVGKSTFDYQGRVISGSAKEPLPVYPVEVKGDKLIIELK